MSNDVGKYLEKLKRQKNEMKKQLFRTLGRNAKLKEEIESLKVENENLKKIISQLETERWIAEED